MKGYRTFGFNALMLVASFAAIALEVASQMLQDPAISALLPTEHAPLILAAVSAVNIVLRVRTNTPVFESDA